MSCLHAPLPVALGSLLLVASLTACQPDEDILALQEPAVAGCSAPAPGAGNVCDRGGGQLEFQVTLPSDERYVEVFARQNGIQNVAQAIQANGTLNGDGTTTYALVRAGYAATDLVEYRFYSYLPDSPGVFTPGPIEQLWYTAVPGPVTHATELPVSKDAAVIYSSLGVGPAADRNFGGATTVDIGEYHLTSEGLFAYALAGVPAGANVLQAELVVPPVYPPGGSIVTLRLNRVVAPWSESSVTWSSRPTYQFVREITLSAGVENRIDVTDLVKSVILDGASEVSVALQPSALAPTTDNVFIPAKEGAGKATSLALKWQ